LIITSLEFDHADIYRDFETYQLAFKRLVNLVPRNGSVVIWGDAQDSGPALRAAVEKAFCPVHTYGFAQYNDWTTSEPVASDDGMRFNVFRKGNFFGKFHLSAFGKHNVLNALAAIIVAYGRGISLGQIQEALETFRSVKRRLDVKGEFGGILVVDDFAHHPTAVRATIAAARGRWPGRRLWAILEPRSNSMRRKIFQEALPQALATADKVILGGVYHAAQLGDENRLDPETVAADVRNLGIEAQVLPGAAAISEYLASSGKTGDLFLIMSNGSFDGLGQKLVEKLSAAHLIPEAARK
jgi:UDP-N-acetylmuramate: L-alanyl-gamma-D-glutamyl-meso-diaminopimelate ligase